MTRKAGVTYDVLPSAAVAPLLYVIPGDEHPDALDVAQAFRKHDLLRWDRAVARVARRRGCDLPEAERLLALALRDPRQPLTSTYSPRTNSLFIAPAPKDQT